MVLNDVQNNYYELALCILVFWFLYTIACDRLNIIHRCFLTQWQLYQLLRQRRGVNPKQKKSSKKYTQPLQAHFLNSYLNILHMLMDFKCAVKRASTARSVHSFIYLFIFNHTEGDGRGVEVRVKRFERTVTRRGLISKIGLFIPWILWLRSMLDLSNPFLLTRS